MGRPHKKLTWIVDARGCHLCTSHALDKDGYPRVMLHGVNTRAHRIVFMRTTGCMPLVVRHTCDTPACINPEHLVSGTHQDNMDDMVARGRQAIGARNGKRRFTSADIRKMKALRLSGVSGEEIARRFRTSGGYVSEILNGKRRTVVVD